MFRNSIEQCHKAIDAFESFRNYCYKKSKDGQIYFNDMWEHYHNSKDPCFSYIQSTKDYLNCISQRKLYTLIPEVPQATIRKMVKNKNSFN